MVMRLQMKFKQKLGVAAVFALGIFVIISSSEYPLNVDQSCATLLMLCQLSGPITLTSMRPC